MFCDKQINHQNTVQLPLTLASDIAQLTSILDEESYVFVKVCMLFDSERSIIPKGKKSIPTTKNSNIKPLMLSFGLNAVSFCCENGVFSGLRDITRRKERSLSDF